MKQQHGMAELYRAGEPVFERSEFTDLDFFGSFCVKAKTNNNSKLHMLTFLMRMFVYQKGPFYTGLIKEKGLVKDKYCNCYLSVVILF